MSKFEEEFKNTCEKAGLEVGIKVTKAPLIYVAEHFKDWEHPKKKIKIPIYIAKELENWSFRSFNFEYWSDNYRLNGKLNWSDTLNDFIFGTNDGYYIISSYLNKLTREYVEVIDNENN